jgi:hypothetical protein
MKLGQFKTIADPSMSDRVPDSDATVSQRVALIQEKLYELGAQENGMLTGMSRVKLKLDMDRILRDHDDAVKAYQNWLDAGRPVMLH